MLCCLMFLALIAPMVGECIIQSGCHEDSSTMYIIHRWLYGYRRRLAVEDSSTMYIVHRWLYGYRR